MTDIEYFDANQQMGTGCSQFNWLLFVRQMGDVCLQSGEQKWQYLFDLRGTTSQYAIYWFVSKYSRSVILAPVLSRYNSCDHEDSLVHCFLNYKCQDFRDQFSMVAKNTNRISLIENTIEEIVLFGYLCNSIQ